MVAAYLLEQAAAVLKTEASRLDAAESLTSLGVDSLMAMELQKRLELQVGVDVPVSQLLQGVTLRELACTVARKLDGQTTQDDTASETVEGELRVWISSSKRLAGAAYDYGLKGIVCAMRGRKVRRRSRSCGTCERSRRTY